jgi:predicted nucleic acid-binding protein
VRVFLDANVLFSASNLASSIADPLFLASESQELVTCEATRAEAWRNILLKRPAWIAGFLRNDPLVSVVGNSTREPPIAIVAKDAVVVASAVECGADLLVTGDRRHLGSLDGLVIEGVRIANVRDWAESVVGPDVGVNDDD